MRRHRCHVGGGCNPPGLRCDQIALDKTLIKLSALVRNVAAAKVPRALCFDVDLGTAEVGNTKPRALWIDANDILLSETLSNVLDNASEYSSPGSEITVHMDSDDEHALVSVSDTGPGLSLADRARVSERFVRATDKGLGCGLGLAIVEEIVSRHGGTVILDDVEPHGHKVTMRVPLQPAPATDGG